MQSDGSIKKHLSGLVLFIVFLAVVSVWFSSYLCQRQAAGMLTATVTESDAFRKMRLSEHTLTELKALASAGSMTMGEILATLYPFCPDGFLSLPSWVHTGGLSAWRGSLLKNNRTGYLLVRNAYAAIWDDVKCFPVAGDAITYENSWMFERTYGGKRGHEGTDLMPPDNLSGVYPVLSMTDGIVENIGWLEQGGYRIG
ncbi:MAG: hypothetical protein LUI07_06175, partial [Lachnospiraceae bacterium]|nr:hypothetical protein [Lachnospiraceae bacterium]